MVYDSFDLMDGSAYFYRKYEGRKPKHRLTYERLSFDRNTRYFVGDSSLYMDSRPVIQGNRLLRVGDLWEEDE